MANAGGSWGERFDVIVVGSGAGAMTGALAAATGGLRTLVIEKTPLLGGTSAYSGAAAWLPGTHIQRRRAEIGDSSEGARTYLRTLLGEDATGHQEAFLGTAPEVAAFLDDDPALEFKWRPFPDYFDAPGRLDRGRSFIPADLPLDRVGELAALVRPEVHRDRAGLSHPQDAPLTTGRALIARLLLALTATGNGEVRTSTALTDLVVEDGRVTGVVASAAGGPVRIAAARGVLLAAGGFEGDPELRAEQGLPGDAAWTMAPAGANTGDAIRAAVRAGAATGAMDQAWWSPGLLEPGGGPAFTLGFRGGVIVDRSGRRFANESLPYDRMGREMAAAPGRVPAYLIFDSREGGGVPAITVPELDPQECLRSGRWVRADGLSELAGLVGLPAGPLTETVERFNVFAAKGVDEDFHRGEDAYDRYFCRGPGANPCLVPLDRPPYYAARVVLSDLGTKGGLRTDPEGRVLDAGDRPIGGLYAAGNTSASFTGPFYPGPGIPIGSAMVFAYRAVKDMSRT